MDHKRERMVKMSACRTCGASILFMRTREGRTIPVNEDSVNDESVSVSEDGILIFNPKTMTSHFATCPDAQKWRKGK